MTDPLGLINRAMPGGPGAIRPQGPAGASAPGQGEPTVSFKDVLMKNLEQVNSLQQDAQTAIEDLATGKRDDVDQVLMATKKADLAFQMLIKVQNKLVSAYDEIKQIRV